MTLVPSPTNADSDSVDGLFTVTPQDEAGQTLSFNITANSNPGLFSAGPTVNANGDLTYTPAVGVTGSAVITLEIMDDGGTANGGVDTSSTQSFTINVNPPPLIENGPAASQAPPDDALLAAIDEVFRDFR